MPKYRYDGEEPCNIASAKVQPGAIVESSFSPGKRFTLIEEPAQPPSAPEVAAFPTAEESGDGMGKGKKNTARGGGE